MEVGGVGPYLGNILVKSDPDMTLFVNDSVEKMVDNPPNMYIVPTTHKGDFVHNFLLSYLFPYMR